MSNDYGTPPKLVKAFPDITLTEWCSYLYMPIRMGIPDRHGFGITLLEARLEHLRPLINSVIELVNPDWYLYLTAKRGYATPDNPLNRPGWHCDGFGTNDLNFVWWEGSGTRFAVQEFHRIDSNHVTSMTQFETQVDPARVFTPPQRSLYRLDPFVVHATPELERGEVRSFVKISASPYRYNLIGNTHNYAFSYDWPMFDRNEVRNDPTYGEADYYIPLVG